MNKLSNTKFGIKKKTRTEISQLVNKYYKEAKKCKKAKAYLSGCIMVGSAFESVLMLAIDCYEEEALLSNKAPKRNNSIKPLLEWSLFDLLNVASDINLLPSNLSKDSDWDDAKAEIGDYGKLIQEMRNCVHPSRYIQVFPKKKIKKHFLNSCFEILDTSIDYLAHKIEESIMNNKK